MATRAGTSRVEQELRAAEDGLTMRELRAATGLHENGLRRTLARLIADGTVYAEPERRRTRGRTAIRYLHAGEPDEAFRQFLPLLLELVDRVPATDDDAYAVGRAHGASTPNLPGSAREAVALHRCPFSDSVTSSCRGRRVCSLHHGMLTGVAEANGGRLKSFTINDPRVCPVRAGRAMTDTPINALERWVACGGTWRLRAMLEPGALVTLCTCHGEPVDELRSADPAFARYVEERMQPERA